YGAEGGGALSVGGRGGAVWLVTNTTDSGTGSLRACVEATGPRTCVFRTGGTINLSHQLSIANPFLTIAGQSAPGGGIQITGAGITGGDPLLQITTHDVVVQYVRLRRGHNLGEQCDPLWTCGANFVLFSSDATTDPSNIVIDHVSSEWSNYEAAIGLGATAAPNEPRRITLSRSIFGEALGGAGQVTAQEVGGYSGAGSTAPDLMTDIDLHHSLLAGASHRFPLWTQKSGRIVNNIMYGYTYYASRGKGFRDFVNNYYALRTGQTVPSHEIGSWPENAGNDTS